MNLRPNAKSLGLAAMLVLGSTVASMAATAYATTNVNVRSGPGPSYRQVDVLRAGQRVDVDRCTGSWCYVVKAGPDGWVSANYLSRGGGGGRDYYDDDYYYDDYDDGFYIRPPRRPHRPYPVYPVYPRYPSSSVCFGNPNASFCISD